MMDKKKPLTNKTAAPGMDEEDAFGRNATESEKKQGETTKVTRLVYDEYDASTAEE